MTEPSIFVITGASSGIGKEIYQNFKTHHAPVVGISHRGGPDIVADLAETKGIEKVLDNLRGKTISCLINCAGALDIDDDHASAHYLFSLNFWAPYHLSMGLRDSFVSGQSSIINISSVSGMMADPDTPIYGASKAALISLTKSLAVKWAPDVRVNCISPGFFDTNLVPGSTPQYLLAPVPLGFEARPRMIIPVIRMLMNCSYMTGANIVVDGGLSCKVA
jgi:NAD(P)-dependent dehydrogenase (short-subunit alcohol dehydrogenase family)